MIPFLCNILHDIAVVVAALTLKLSLFALIFGFPMTLFLLNGGN